jgi:hypothetical protein
MLLVSQEKINARFFLFLFDKTLGPKGYFLECKTSNLGWQVIVHKVLSWGARQVD